MDCFESDKLQDITNGRSGRKKWREPSSGLDQHPGTRKRILIVDDDVIIRWILERGLSAIGYEATETGSGFEALDMLGAKPFDLVITDLQMPGMDGWGLARHVKKMFPRTPVLLLTAQRKNDVMKNKNAVLIDSFISKPFRLEEVETEIERILTGK